MLLLAAPRDENHPIRRLILEALRARPGLSYTQLLEEARRHRPGFGAGALNWHLYKLGGADRIASIRVGRLRRYYPRAGPWAGDLEGFAFVDAPGLRTLARILVEQPGLRLRQVQSRMPLGERRDRAWLRHQLRRLVRNGLASVEKRGRLNVLQPTPRLVKIVGALDSFRPLQAPMIRVPLEPPASGLPRPVVPPPGAAPLLLHASPATVT